MAFLGWTPAYSVGIDRFDAQHKTLVGLINDLHSAMMAGRGNEALGTLFDALAEYTVTHFADEERVMLEHRYPWLLGHRQEHAKLVSQVAALQKKFKRGNGHLTVEVMAFLKDWLVTHIQGHDHAYGDYLRERNVK